ncbi:hypothetical protein SAMN04488096_11045 [Mesonia phycicola]|uniref:Uncharacterized protein n=1 Tax=Mesonia phycicola TaxID=579105 RepID=A0A1M6HBI5_9FLAO|nr:hypothetical protein [Mesonia phycicola]SHJ19587.1 hypothetical protein SAMN04488096_11045 [Mesonia phycicola]
MSAIFKEHIVPNITIESLQTTETNALLQVLELMDATETSAYNKLKNSSEATEKEVHFTEQIAQSIYFHPRIYANEQEGLELVASWLPLVKHGFYPDEKSTDKLITFLYFSLSYFNSDAISETLKTQIFQVLKALVQSKSVAALPVARFLVQRIFDIRDVLNSDFLIQNCINHHILDQTYAVVNTDNTITEFPFKIDNDFIQYFFDNNWRHFIAEFHRVLPVGRVYAKGAYDLMLPWFSEDLADYYYNNLSLIYEAHKALKDRFIFGESKSLELLNLQTSEGFYPLIAGLGPKTWDAGDVLLFSNRDKNIPQEYLQICYEQFIEWLNADGGSNFYTEAFNDYGKKILTEQTAELLPVHFIPFWFSKCHPKSGIKTQTETYNTIFSKLLLEDPKGTLPKMYFQNEPFQVTGTFLIQEVFQINDNLKAWLHHLTKAGISNPLNQFLVCTFYDADKEILEHYSTEQQDILQLYLLELAYSARDANTDIRTQYLPLIVATLGNLCVESGNFTRVNEIWALKDIDTCVTKQCNDFARAHYVNENNPLTLHIVQAWFNYLADYYYSFTQEAVWVENVLSTQGFKMASYFNHYNDDVRFFLDRALNRIITFHRKSKLKQAENDVLGGISTKIEYFLTDFLTELNENKLNQNTVQYLKNYNENDVANFKNHPELVTAIDGFYDFYFKEEPQTAPKVNVEQLPTSKIEIEFVEINKNYVEAVLHNLEHYKDKGDCNTELLQVFEDKIDDLKIWLANDTTGIENRFSQALYMALLDPNLAPKTQHEKYGALCRSLFTHLVKGSKMAASYAMGLQAMAKSGAYSEALTTALLQVVDQLNA